MEVFREPDSKTHPKNSKPQLEPYEEPDEDEEEEELEQDENEDGYRTRMQAKTESFFKRLSTERVPVHVHDIIIKGNTRTQDSLIEFEVEEVLRGVSSFQQLLHAASVATTRLRALDIFDSVLVTLDAGPPELPGTTNVVIEVSEPKYPLSGNIGLFTKPGARSWTLEGIGKLKNLFGYGDLWDASGAYGWGQLTEASVGVSLPRFKAIPTPITARISSFFQDWSKFSSYKEQALGLSLGLLSTGKHDLSYNLAWRTLTDPSQMSSHTVRRQLGHNLLSALKYGFKVDRRDSALRPTRGFAFLSTTQVGGLFPDFRSARFIRQEVDLRYAFPLGFYRAALNVGISAGLIFPWGRGALDAPSYLTDRFFMGGNTSPVCSLIGPTSVFGFKGRGLGPAEPRRLVRDPSSDGDSDASGIDHVGGDLALTAFADLSFDLPLKVLTDAGIHGHVFASTGSLNKLTEKAYQGFSLQKFRDSFRTSVGFGVIVPTQIFRMEVNYCYVLKQQAHDQGKTGVQFCFSPH